MTFVIPNIGLKSLRIFLSYADEEKGIVGELKRLLEDRGFEVFVAHDDIPPTKNFDIEILNNLKRCDIFIPIISNNFKKSEWTDQETGIAISSDKLIIPLILDLPPYGFLDRIQGLKIKKDDLANTVHKIFEIIKEHDKFKKEINDFIINSFLSSLSFEQANARSSDLKNIRNFTKEQLERLVNGTLQNNQICGGFISKRLLKNIFQNLEKYIIKEKFIEVMENLK